MQNRARSKFSSMIQGAMVWYPLTSNQKSASQSLATLDFSNLASDWRMKMIEGNENMGDLSKLKQLCMATSQFQKLLYKNPLVLGGFFQA